MDRGQLKTRVRWFAWRLGWLVRIWDIGKRYKVQSCMAMGSAYTHRSGEDTRELKACDLLFIGV